MEKAGTLLEMKGISKNFGPVKALKNVEFSLQKGQVHVLVGENGAGKSTLIKILNGLYNASAGEMIFDGNKVNIFDNTPKKMLEMGVATIHQELSPIREMTIAENIFLGIEPLTKAGFVDFRLMNAEAKEAISEMGFYYNPKQKMEELTVSDIQIIEIIKAIHKNAKLIIMDEPSSSITLAEVQVMFEQVRKLKERGVGIIYITHKMDEIFQIGDVATVLRDGETIETRLIEQWDPKSLIAAMVGREMSDIYPEKKNVIGDVALRVENLSKKNAFENISFFARKGEILGFAGLVGAGRTEVFRTIFGLDAYDSGKIWLDDREIVITCPKDAINYKIGMLSEDRRGEGLVIKGNVLDNIMLPNLDKYLNKLGMLQKKKQIQDAEKYIKLLNVKLYSPRDQVENLSGGNQQKVAIAKWLLRDVKILIFDEPTRGIDVGAKFEIYKLMCALAEQGKTIIMISSELPELIGVCDRIVVMYEGKITGELERCDFSQEKIMEFAVGGAKNENNGPK